MNEPSPLSRSQLASAAGVPEDVIVFWIRKGLVQSSETRDRKHRRFDGIEVKLCMIFAELRSYGMNIDALTTIAAIFREGLAIYELVDEPSYMIEALQDLEYHNFDRAKAEADLAKGKGITESEIKLAVDAAMRVPKDKHSAWWIGKIVSGGADFLSIYRDDSDAFQVLYGRTESLVAASVLILDLGIIYGRIAVTVRPVE